MSKPKPKLLVIGHGRHGKDTFCEILRDYHGYKFISSSEFCLHETIWDNWGRRRYKTKEDCYQGRHFHRATWANMISEYNRVDKTKTASTMFYRGYDIYCGMRRRDELEACNDAQTFEHVVWVDRSDHLPPEDASSMELTEKDATVVVDNNGSMRDLWLTVDDLVKWNYYD
jgi:hypothetical protein